MFPNIQLPDSNINEQKSHGFFTYSIKTKVGISQSDTINNTANIYFDYNTPISTNTVQTYYVAAIPNSLQNISQIKVELFPNPTSGKIIVSMDENYAKFSLTDINGKILVEKNISNNNEINLDGFANGIYFGKVITNKGIKQFKIKKQN